jgi:hypothetical protein
MPRRKAVISTVLLLLLVALPICIAVELRINRDNGTQIGDKIKGKFSARLRDTEGIEKVEFYLDGELVLTDEEEPFRWDFRTSDYPDGVHTIKAIAYLSDGGTVEVEDSREFTTDFGQWWTLFIWGTILFVAGLSLFAIWVTNRERKQPQGKTRCPQCDTVFDRQWSPMHMGDALRNTCPTCAKSFWAKKISDEEAN